MGLIGRPQVTSRLWLVAVQGGICGIGEKTGANEMIVRTEDLAQKRRLARSGFQHFAFCFFGRLASLF